jgi:hypothetical protein
MRFTKQIRQGIVEEFARRHNGQYNPGLFLQEVRDTGESHAAYEWFEWDADKAVQAYQLEQARAFARDLRVSFQIEEIERKPVRVTAVDVPLVISPMSGRRDGGGYFLVDPDNPEHLAEHCKQAATALRSWMRRYHAALVHSGASAANVEKVAKLLEARSPQLEAA